ncbi:MAG TPA: 16S rRNA (uracil(1498)-N(3))-methyltransferase [Verrucomicrobiae bacterium]|nr:16S rRNA (uracil(1498)-N(3))-methyltransferase [Verrucomicrobiae bacterium]
MNEPRVYVDIELREGDIVTLPQEAYHHLVVVLRRMKGDAVTLFNGRGGEYGVTLESIAKRSVDARVTAFRDVSRESALPVTLAQAVSKGERMDFTIQKAVELGVTEIQPLITDHVVVKLSEERWARKLEHWQSVAVSACEQSGRTRIPRIAPVIDLRDWLNALPAGALKLVLAPGAAAGRLTRRAEPIALLVGPEGGLSDMELKLTDISGFVPVPLGPRILRTETAGMVALAVIQSAWGDLGASLSTGK